MTELLKLIQQKINVIYLSVLLPVASSGWRTLTRLKSRLATTQNRHLLRRWILLPISQADRFITAYLPRRLRQNKLALWLLVGFLLLLSLQFSRDFSLDDLKESGELVVISRESPTTWYEGNEGPAGPDFDYLTSFADYLGVKLRFDIRENNQQILDAISRDEGHIAAAGLTSYASLEDQGFLFGPEYQLVDIQVVCRRNHGKRPRKIEDLIDIELVVVADSNYESRLFELQQEYPELNWESIEETSAEALLELVWRKKIDCTVANSSEINIKRRFYPELQVAFTIQEDQSLAWNLSPKWEILSASIEDWLDVIGDDGTLLILKDRHYKVEEFDYVDMCTFIRRIKSRLKGLESMLKKAADKHQVPWTLLAAQSYQESHWNRRAKSPTGVRGIMMLTLVTAKEMGVESRLDAEQSIMGGAKYLQKLESRIPQTVSGDDRWWYALTAYNLGMGHLRDARQLAEKLDLDPDSWLDLKGVLPLLTQKKYYRDLKHGYARGSEATTYVRRVRNYQNILRAQIAKRGGYHAS